jgi:hypothetical protein
MALILGMAAHKTHFLAAEKAQIGTLSPGECL